VMTYNRLHAVMLADRWNFAPFHKLLDLGGLSSAFSIEAMRRNPDLRTTFAFDSGFLPAVRREVAEAGFADRVTCLDSGITSALPHGEYDLVMVNHVVHRYSESRNLAILEN